MSVILRGELDLDTGEHLWPELLRALGGSTDGVDLHLSDVSFCDCSGLHLLLDLRRLGLRQGKTVTVLSNSIAVARVFDLTGTQKLFAPSESPNGKGDDAMRATKEEAVSDGVSDEHCDDKYEESLRTAVRQSQKAVQIRPTIDLARGILMSAYGLSPEASWEVLVTASQNAGTDLHHLAERVVGTTHGTGLPEDVREHLTSAVAQANDSRIAPRHSSAPGTRSI
ncbi:ANTAR domain-containing protein [Streptomyces sp. NPDC055060]